MNKQFAAVLVLMFFVSTGSTEPWKISTDENLLLSQSAYSDNWSGGEAGNVNWTMNSNSLAEKQLSEKVNNKTTLKISFGQIYRQDVISKDWAKSEKSTDLFDLESVFRLTIGGFVDPFGSVRIETQLLDSRDPLYGRNFNPITYTESIGIAKIFIKEVKKEFGARFGAALRQHQDRGVLNPITAQRETLNTNDGGLMLVSDMVTPLAEEKINFTSKLTIFQALFYSEADNFKGLPEEDHWKSADINWENIFSANITKYIAVNLYIQFLFDKQIHAVGRLKETLALGVTYKFSNQ